MGWREGVERRKRVHRKGVGMKRRNREEEESALGGGEGKNREEKDSA